MIFKEFNNILVAQEELNNKYNPTWRESVVMEQQLTAVYTELAEWFESAPRAGGVTTNGVDGWKFWKKNISCDIQNKKIEIIDVLHFLMSTWLMLGEKEAITELVNSYVPEKFPDGSNLKNILRYHASYTTFCFEGVLNKAVYSGLCLLNVLMEESDMTWEDLENGYFLKNNLNHQRVENGYQEGNYAKHDANGHEDNRKLNV
jgi:dimeric dUTPase (all-alpha-NTP-PPase superfamily)